MKRAAADGTVLETVPRSDLWLAQTPQIFSFSTLWAAHQRAKEENYVGTDESELVERNGGTVTLVAASEMNIKITTPVNLEMALAMLDARRATSVGS